MMQQGITILGTGGDAQVVGRQMRASAGFVLTTPQSQVHIDPGPGTLLQLAKHELHPRETTAVVVTHQHVNHANDASALISAMTLNGMDRRGVLLANDLVTGAVSAFHQGLVERCSQLVAGRKVGVNDVDIHAVATKHYASGAVGLLIHAPGYIVGYTGDTVYSKDLAESFKGANILIINCKHPFDVREGDHLNVQDASDLIAAVKPQLAILTHFGAKMLASDPLQQARNIQHATGVQTIAAKDGLHIAPSSYSVKQKQKTLSGM